MRKLDKKPFRELIDRYRSITIEELRGNNSGIENIEIAEDIMMNITGFGIDWVCPLCQYFNNHCFKCYGSIAGCGYGEHEASYRAIAAAKTIEELYQAINARADHIEEWIEKFEEER